MNARQKAKKLKKENERLKKLLDPHTDTYLMTNTRKYPIRPEILRMKYLIKPFMTEEMMKNEIEGSFGRCLLETGFIDTKRQFNEIMNQTEVVASLIACRWPF